MLKFVNKSNNEEECFLYSKFIPRMGDLVLKGGKYYKVDNVIFDDDEGDIIIEVVVDTCRMSSNEIFSKVPRETMNTVISLLREGSKLTAVKLLKETAGIGLKEAKEFCDNLQN